MTRPALEETWFLSGAAHSYVCLNSGAAAAAAVLQQKQFCSVVSCGQCVLRTKAIYLTFILQRENKKTAEILLLYIPVALEPFKGTNGVVGEDDLLISLFFFLVFNGPVCNI